MKRYLSKSPQITSSMTDAERHQVIADGLQKLFSTQVIVNLTERLDIFSRNLGTARITLNGTEQIDDTQRCLERLGLQSEIKYSTKATQNNGQTVVECSFDFPLTYYQQQILLQGINTAIQQNRPWCILL